MAEAMTRKGAFRFFCFSHRHTPQRKSESQSDDTSLFSGPAIATFCCSELSRKGTRMRFPNLVYAISLRRMTHYEAAQAAGLSEWRFSRLLNGRTEFSPAERKCLTEVLGFDEGWLFARPAPPSRAVIEATTDVHAPA